MRESRCETVRAEDLMESETAGMGWRQPAFDEVIDVSDEMRERRRNRRSMRMMYAIGALLIVAVGFRRHCSTVPQWSCRVRRRNPHERLRAGRIRRRMMRSLPRSRITNVLRLLGNRFWVRRRIRSLRFRAVRGPARRMMTMAVRVPKTRNIRDCWIPVAE